MKDEKRFVPSPAASAVGSLVDSGSTRLTSLKLLNVFPKSKANLKKKAESIASAISNFRYR